MESLFDLLNERGFEPRSTDERLPSKLAREKLTVYAGFDPTSDSLQLGNLLPVMALAHFQRAGHRVIVLVGGATGLIGDPSGKSDERKLLDTQTVAANAAAIKTQLEKFLFFDGDNAAVMVDNLSWFDSINVLPFFRDIGKHFNMKVMLAKDSVKSRLDSESGMSFTEFAYQVFQGFDFLHLFDTLGCILQLGGSDQWGNITAGIDLVRRVRQKEVFGLTIRLVTTANGEKFGKSAGNAVWLDARRTSPWEMFQFLIRQEDGDVIKLLRLLTFVPDSEIAELEKSLATNAAARLAQRKLAFQVTALVHGTTVAREMERASHVMFGGEIKELSEETLDMVFASVPSSEISHSELDTGVPLSVLLARTGLATSRGNARKFIDGGGANINNVRATSDVTVTRQHLLTPRHIVLRRGKGEFHVLRVVSA